MLFISILVAVVVCLWRRHAGDSPTVDWQAEQLRGFVASSFPVAQNIHLQLADPGFRFPDLADAVQKQLDYRLAGLGCPYRYPIISDLPDRIERPDEFRGPPAVFYTEPETTGTETCETTTEIFETNPKKSETTPKKSVTTPRKSGNCEPLGNSGSRDTAAPVHPQYSVHLHYWYKPSIWLDTENFSVHMSYDLDFIHRNDLPFFVTQAIFDLLIAPDLEMWKSGKQYSSYVQDYQINFIGAEESGSPPKELMQSLGDFVSKYKVVGRMTNVTSCIEGVDISKRLVSPQYLRNNTEKVNFMFSTSLKPYVNSVQGVPLFHLEKVRRVESVPGAEYGTAREQAEPRILYDAYDISDFVQEAVIHIESALGLPEGNQPLGLRVDAASKHYAVQGIITCLDLLLVQDFSNSPSLSQHYDHLCALVDTILMQQSHDWPAVLSQVSALHGKIAQPIDKT